MRGGGGDDLGSLRRNRTLELEFVLSAAAIDMAEEKVSVISMMASEIVDLREELARLGVVSRDKGRTSIPEASHPKFSCFTLRVLTPTHLSTLAITLSTPLPGLLKNLSCPPRIDLIMEISLVAL